MRYDSIPNILFQNNWCLNDSFLNTNSISKSNDVMLELLSNWEIIVFTNAIPELSKYALENMIDKL